MGTNSKSKSRKKSIKVTEASGLVRLCNAQIFVEVGYEWVVVDIVKSGGNDSNVSFMVDNENWDKLVKEVERGRKQFATRSK